MSKRNISSYFTIACASSAKRLKTDTKKNDMEGSSEEINQEKSCKSTRKVVNNATFLKWQKENPWLTLDENLMVCTVCKEFAKAEDTNFVNGCPALRYETVSNFFSDNIYFLILVYFYALNFFKKETTPVLIDFLKTSIFFYSFSLLFSL